MCKRFEMKLIVDLVKSENIHNFWRSENSLQKKKGGGGWTLNIYPICVLE